MASTRGNVIKRTRKKGHVFQARYWDHGGKMRSRTFNQKADAERWLVVTLSQLQRGDLIDPTKGRTTFRVFAAHWLDDLNVRPNTLSAYKVILNRHLVPTFGDTALRNITTESVRRWHAQLKRSGTLNETSIAKCYRLLRQVFSVAMVDGYIQKNPCAIKDGGKEPAYAPKVPTTAEVLALAEAVPAHYKALVLIAGFGGLRWGEAIGLRRKHIDLGEGCVRVMEQLIEACGQEMMTGETKTSAGKRTVYLPTFVTTELEAHLATITTQPNTLLFSADRPVGLKAANREERYLRRSNFRQRVWLPATKQVGCEGVRFHDLRHCAATLAATTGATLKELMAHIGHSTTAAALRYQHVTDDRQRRIATGIQDLVKECS